MIRADQEGYCHVALLAVLGVFLDAWAYSGQGVLHDGEVHVDRGGLRDVGDLSDQGVLLLHGATDAVMEVLHDVGAYFYQGVHYELVVQEVVHAVEVDVGQREDHE